jgi:Peptidase family S41
MTEVTEGAVGRAADGPAAGLLADAPDEVRDILAGSVELRDFRRTAGLLTLDERRLLVDQALILIEQNYVHLPLKAAMHAVNPVQRLRLLRARLSRQSSVDEVPELQFHAEMSEIFHSMRDLHTNYLLPQPFAGKIAYQPFLVEEYVDAGTRRYVVTKVVNGFTAPGFGAGAEVTHWNGVPIDRAVDLNAARFAGSNAAARHSRGVESLTLRPLRIHLPPDEEWVTVGYVGLDGTARELRQPWLVATNLPPFADLDQVSVTAANTGLDLGGDEAGRARKLLFAPVVAASEQAGTAEPVATGDADVPTTMPGVFRARAVTTASGAFGHIRIFTFSVDDPDGFVAEFVRLIGLLPQNGLIVDVRGNGGGHIFASEFALQTLTPRRISPEPVQFIGTPLNLRICRQHEGDPTGQIDLTPWVASLAQTTETGAAFSAAQPITPEEGANAIGQHYTGPVVLVTDARCYSATDIFAAGFADHGIGPVLGVDANTGAGGANVWTHGLLKQLLELPSVDPQSPYRTLPRGANMRVSIRRTLRVGALAGTPVEDLGVVPDERHDMTRDDLVHDNRDLLDHAGRLLAALPVRRLVVRSAALAGSALALRLDLAGLDRLDVYVEGRPRASFDVADGTTEVTVNGVADGTLRLDGYAGPDLVASRALVIS